MLHVGVDTAQKVNFAGRAHATLSRIALRARHETWQPANLPTTRREVFTRTVMKNGWQGALAARTIASPATVAMDALFSNCRARPILEHPCDLGLARCCLVAVSAGIFHYTMLFASMAPGAAALGASRLACVCGLVAAAGNPVLDFVLVATAALTSWTLLLRGTWLSDGANLGVPVRGWLDRSAYGWYIAVTGTALTMGGAFLFLTKQVLGLSTAGVKGSITLLSFGIGALVGVAAGLHRASAGQASSVTAQLSHQPHCIALEKALSVNQETVVNYTPLQDVPEHRWFSLRTGDVLHGFDSLELAQWLASRGQRALNDSDRWINPYNRVEMTAAQRVALATHPDGETRDIMQQHVRLAAGADATADEAGRGPRETALLVLRHLFL